MATITLPREITKNEELIAIPRREYEDYLHLRKVIPVVKMTTADKKKWQRAKKDYKQGKYITLEDLQNELGFAYKRKS